ncbi:hypothetical protein ACLOJK_025439 [Asimina triloba]
MSITANRSHSNNQDTNPFRHRSTSRDKKPPHSHCCSTLLISCMGITSSTPLPNIHQQQVGNLEREMERVREQNRIYKEKLDRLKDCLRHYLETAQEQGFLDFIAPYPNQSPLSIESISKLGPNSAVDPRLSTITHQAKFNGWYIEPDEIALHEEVGQGSTARIHRGTWRGLDVAVKCLKADLFSSPENGYVWFAQELAILSRQRHPFVLHLMGACLMPPTNAWLVTELLSGRTLKEWLHGKGERCRERMVPLAPLEARVEKGLEIAQAMQYLHEQKPRVLHRDLKPSNIFVDDAGHVKVADFGFARFLLEEQRANTGETGTYVYMAPEVIRNEAYDEKCDVYSFGVVLNELLTGQYPYVDTDYTPSQIAIGVAQGMLRPTLPKDADGWPQELLHLVRNTWDENAFIRPSFTMITSTLKKIKSLLNEESNDES